MTSTGTAVFSVAATEWPSRTHETTNTRTERSESVKQKSRGRASDDWAEKRKMDDGTQAPGQIGEDKERLVCTSVLASGTTTPPPASLCVSLRAVLR